MTNPIMRANFLVSRIDDWTRLAGEIYSIVLRNPQEFGEFQKTVAWQFIRSVAESQEKLHTVAKEATHNARNNHIS